MLQYCSWINIFNAFAQDGDGKITNTEFKLSFDTPGSSVDREYSINYQLDRKANTLKANFRTPERKLELSGEV